MKKTVWLTASLMMMSIALPSCGGSTQQGQEQQTQAMPYKTMSVSAGDRELEQSYSATIRGRQDIDIYPQVSGRLTQVLVNEGDVVRKGQTLFIIDQVPYQAALAQARANIQAAKAALSTAKITLDAKQRLFNEKVISQIELDMARNNYQSAEASLAQAKAAELIAHNNLSYTTVTSPADGVVGTLPYRQGTLVSSAMPSPLTTVSDNNQMYVYFSLGEKTLLDLTRKYGSLEAAVKSMGAVQLRLSDGSLYESTGTVESISGVIDRTTGASSLRAQFANPNHLLHSGATGSIILKHSYSNIIVIPQAATYQLQDKVFAYKVVDGKATSTLITVEPINNGTEYLVTDGLKTGDVIIAEGAGLVREGAAVAPAQSEAKK